MADRGRDGLPPSGSRSSRLQNDQNPFDAANEHVTSSDIAFWGDRAYVGDYGGFRVFDISQPTPTLVCDVRCYGAEVHPSVFDRDGGRDRKDRPAAALQPS